MKTYSEFHDGFFEGLHIPDDTKVVHLYLCTLEKERTTAVLTGVVMLKAGGFRAGNIISVVSTRDSGEITLADIGDLYELDSCHEPKPWEHKLMERVGEQHLQILDVSASYGGTCSILAQTIEFVAGEHL
jgi:hypothetical protein